MAQLLTEASLGMLIGIVSAFFVGATLVGLGIGFLCERLMNARTRIFADAIPPSQYRHEAIGNVVFVLVTIASFTVVLHFDLVRFGPESVGSFLLTVLAMNVLFQAHFYALHRALHHPRLLRFHRWHHVSRVTTPLSGQSTSFVEALGWMGGYVVLPALLSQVVPLSAAGLVTYIGYNVVGNIVGHANVELVPPAKGLRTRSLFATVFTYHALHHLRYTGHYGFASTWLDRLLATEWPDWMTLHARVSKGEPLDASAARRVTAGADEAMLRGASS